MNCYLKWIFENGTGIVAIVTSATLILQGLIQYFVSQRYSKYYKIPISYFIKINKLAFYEAFTVFLMTLLILVLYPYLGYLILEDIADGLIKYKVGIFFFIFLQYSYLDLLYIQV